jgi:hypothetical protein
MTNSFSTAMFIERFGFCPTLKAKAYKTHLGFDDIAYSGVIDGKTYTWSSAYGWDDEA